MAGDYQRYVCEVRSGAGRAAAVDKAEAAYRAASQLAPSLATTNTARLGLALNFSVFLWEMKGAKEEAMRMARQAFDAAVADLDKLEPDNFLDASGILQLLRDNLSLWNPQDPADRNARLDPADRSPLKDNP